MLVYVWARRNPFVRMNFFGLLTFQAPYLPYVLLGFSLLLGNSVSVDLLGMAVGHTYYYLEDIFPNQPGGWQIIKTPQILKVLCDEAPEDPNYAPPPEERPGGYDWGQGEGADDQGDNNNVLHNDENQNLQEMPPNAPNNNDNVLWSRVEWMNRYEYYFARKKGKSWQIKGILVQFDVCSINSLLAASC